MNGPVNTCGSCGRGDLIPVLDLGSQPLPQATPGADQTARYPLTLVRCARCTLVQLGYIVPQSEVFGEDYPYVTGNSPALREHFAGLAMTVAGMIISGGLVVDIGGNDGTFLRALRKIVPAAPLLLIEPTRQARKAGQAGIDFVQEYWTVKLAQDLHASYGPAKVICASSVFGHVPDPHDFLDGVTALLADDGTLIIENQDWFNVVNLGQVDTVYHEHLRYYTPASLAWLLERHGLIITTLTRTGMHGGAFRAVAVRERTDLLVRTIRLDYQLNALLEVAAEAGPVYAIGAPTRATSLVNYTGIGRYLDCACEITGSEKIGAVIPGTTVPVVDEQALFDDQPPHALLLAWDLADVLVPKLRARGYTGKFIVPLPEPVILDD